MLAQARKFNLNTDIIANNLSMYSEAVMISTSHPKRNYLSAEDGVGVIMLGTVYEDSRSNTNPEVSKNNGLQRYVSGIILCDLSSDHSYITREDPGLDT